MTKTGNVFTRYFQQFDWSGILDEIFSKLVSLVFLILLFYIAKKSLHLLVAKIIAPSLKLSRQDEARQKTITRLIENLLNYALYFLLFYWILSILGMPVSSLLAGAGIAGVAIGMGAQGFLSDLVNGFFILLERQLDVGDSVRLTNGPINIAGTVVSVGIRTTQIRDADGSLHYIPNRNIMVVSNLSRGDMRVLIDIPINAQTDLDSIARVIEKVNQASLKDYPEILQEPDILGPQLEENSQFVFRVSMMVQSGTQTKIYHSFYRLYHEALLKEGMDLPN